MANRKTIFVAFAIEDERQRDFLKSQSLLTLVQYEYIDISVKEAYDKNWKDFVSTRIRRSDGVIVLVSESSLGSAGQKWEIEFARSEGKKILAIWAYSEDRTVIPGLRTLAWTRETIRTFMESL